MKPTRKDRAPRPGTPHPVTPDGRYFVVRGRLWRCANPTLPPETRKALTARLMQARRQKAAAIRNGDSAARETARQQVDEAKHLLGERGPAWWTDGAPDWNRHLAKNTPYAHWLRSLPNLETNPDLASQRKSPSISPDQDTPPTCSARSTHLQLSSPTTGNPA